MKADTGIDYCINVPLFSDLLPFLPPRLREKVREGDRELAFLGDGVWNDAAGRVACSWFPSRVALSSKTRGMLCSETLQCCLAENFMDILSNMIFPSNGRRGRAISQALEAWIGAVVILESRENEKRRRRGQPQGSWARQLVEMLLQELPEPVRIFCLDSWGNRLCGELEIIDFGQYWKATYSGEYGITCGSGTESGARATAVLFYYLKYWNQGVRKLVLNR